MKNKLLIATAAICMFTTISVGYADEVSQKNVTVSAYDYTAHDKGVAGASSNGIILDKYSVAVNDGDSTADIIKKAFEENSIQIEGTDTGYVSSINGLGVTEGYSGWYLSYNNDDYSNWGMSSLTLADGDNIRFDYSCNFDYSTDDIGNGFYGLPIVTSFKAGNAELTFGKEGSYDENYNYTASYYQLNENGEKEILDGDGTEDNPFIIKIPKSDIEDITSVTAQTETSLNPHYCVIDGLEENQNYTEGVNFTVSTLGGLHKTSYKAEVVKEKADFQNIYLSTGKYMSQKNLSFGSSGGEWAVLGLARSYYPVSESCFEDYYKTVEDTMIDKAGVLSTSKITDYSRLIIALTSIGKDVENVAGYNLLSYLTDYDKIVKQGLNGPIYALLALDSNSYEIPSSDEAAVQTTRENLIQYIIDNEITDGGWTLFGTAPDPDITAMALEALAPYYKDNEAVKTGIDKAVNVLSIMQNENGAYASWGSENLESNAQVLTALSVLGINADKDERFIKNNISLLDAMLAYYVDGGGFSHTAGTAVNQMATEQAYYAMAAYERLVNGKNSLYDMSDVWNYFMKRIENGVLINIPTETEAYISRASYNDTRLENISMEKDTLTTGYHTYDMESWSKIMLWDKEFMPLCEVCSN